MIATLRSHSKHRLPRPETMRSSLVGGAHRRRSHANFPTNVLVRASRRPGEHDIEFVYRPSRSWDYISLVRRSQCAEWASQLAKERL